MRCEAPDAGVPVGGASDGGAPDDVEHMVAEVPEPVKQRGAPMALKRILKQAQDSEAGPPGNCSARPVGDDLFHCQVTIMGPPGSAYTGGVLLLNFNFPPDYVSSPRRCTSQRRSTTVT